jgi:hypothetical protein
MVKNIEETPKILGYYHKFNCMKFRIAYALFIMKKPKDTRQIAELLGEPQNKISNAFSRYKSTGLPYFQRVRKWRGASNHDVNWRLTKSGVNFLANCFVNIHAGVDLNFKHNPQKVKIKDRRVLYPSTSIPFYIH